MMTMRLHDKLVTDTEPKFSMDSRMEITPATRLPGRTEIVRRFRKVAWGRLYWRRNNPNSRQFDSDDIAMVRNGVVTTHYTSTTALLEDIEREEQES